MNKMILTTVLTMGILCSPLSYGADEHSQHHQHGIDVPGTKTSLSPGMLSTIPDSGKAREANHEGSYAMPSTGIAGNLATQCAQATRGLIMIDNATWQKCGGKVKGASKGPGHYPAVYPWNKAGTGETSKMDHSMHDMQQMASHSGMMAHGHHGAGNHQQHGSMGDHWMAPKEAARRKNPVLATQVSIQSGKVLFQKNCVSCHGTSARGDGPLAKALTPKPADLVAMAPTHPDGGLAWKIAEGRGPMPGWKQSLSEKEIWHVVNFLKSLSKGKLKPKPKTHHDNHQHKH